MTHNSLFFNAIGSNAWRLAAIGWLGLAVPVWANTPVLVADTPVSAAYLRARAEAAQGAVGDAAQDYAQALTAAPDNVDVASRAWGDGLTAGDYALARRAMAVLVRTGKIPPDLALFGFADALRNRDWSAADAALPRLAGGPLGFLMPVLRAWLVQAQGGDGAALLDPAVLDRNKASVLVRRYGVAHRGLLLIAAGQTDAGLAVLKPWLDSDGISNLKLATARLLVGTGAQKQALALLPDGADSRKLLGRGVKPDAALGVAWLLTDVAGDVQAQQDSDPQSQEGNRAMTILLTRVALLLDPGNDFARLSLARALARGHAYDAALTVLAGVRRDGGQADVAGEASVRILVSAGRAGEALQQAEALAKGPDAPVNALQTLGDVLIGQDRYGEAADAYRRALDRAGKDAGWVLNLQLGGALEQAGRWGEALPLLRHAVALAPDQPEALNTLGYTLATRRLELPAAEALLRHAAQLAPEDAAITDSLAWAYFQQGEVARALPLLEKAVQAEPGDSTINEHLGDAYWRLGRHFEARYAWRAAAFQAGARDKERIDGKIAAGLPG